MPASLAARAEDRSPFWNSLTARAVNAGLQQRLGERHADEKRFPVVSDERRPALLGFLTQFACVVG